MERTPPDYTQRADSTQPGSPKMNAAKKRKAGELESPKPTVHTARTALPTPSARRSKKNASTVIVMAQQPERPHKRAKTSEKSAFDYDILAADDETMEMRTSDDTETFEGVASYEHSLDEQATLDAEMAPLITNDEESVYTSDQDDEEEDERSDEDGDEDEDVFSSVEVMEVMESDSTDENDNVPTSAPVQAEADRNPQTAQPKPDRKRKARGRTTTNTVEHTVANRPYIIPNTPPQDAFRIAIPSKVAPWTHAWSAPTNTFSEVVDSCPMNWNFIRANSLSGLKDTHITAYEAKGPWNPEHSQPTWHEVLNALKKKGHTEGGTDETARKLFAQANRRVYEATGVYFEKSCFYIGDSIRKRTKAEKESDDGINKAVENETMNGAILADDAVNEGSVNDQIEGNKIMERLVKEHESAELQRLKAQYLPQSDVVEFILRPNQTHEDRCLKCCEEGVCYDEACRAHDNDCCPVCCYQVEVYPIEDCREPDCGGDQCRCPCIHRPQLKEPEHSPARWRAHLEQMRVPFDCPNPDHQPLQTRSIELSRLEAVSQRDFEDITLLNVEPKAFDIFASCIAPETLHQFPQRFTVLKGRRLDDGEDSVHYKYEDAETEYTIGDLLKAYCCSQALECWSVSDVILRQLWQIIQDEDSAFGSDHDVETCRSEKHSPPDTTDVERRILDFEPEDINHVYRSTTNDDPIRLLLQDIITYKGMAGVRKIEADENKYHPEFLAYWKLREDERKIKTLSILQDRYKELKVEISLVPSPDESRLRELNDELKEKAATIRTLKTQIDGLPQQLAQLSEKIINDTQEHGLVGDLHLHREGDWDDEDTSIIWGGCSFLGWQPKESYEGEFTEEEAFELFGQTETTNILVFKDEDAFCRTYHNHGVIPYQCYRTIDQPITPTARPPDFVQRLPEAVITPASGEGRELGSASVAPHERANHDGDGDTEMSDSAITKDEVRNKREDVGDDPQEPKQVLLPRLKVPDENGFIDHEFADAPCAPALPQWLIDFRGAA